MKLLRPPMPDPQGGGRPVGQLIVAREAAQGKTGIEALACSVLGACSLIVMVEFAQLGSVLHAGEVIAGKYRLDAVLGAGGMGVVLAATHLELEERVALKVLLPEVAKDPSAVTRFAREARACAKIRSAHVARTFDVGRLDNGCPFLVMEYLEGTDLSRRIAEHGPMLITEAVDCIIQALDAVAEAHLLGIVHRDIKPANLFMVRRSDGSESVKVLDFGISKMSGGSGMQMTHTSAVMGSPFYMSPEQMESATRADPRSDIWALGVTLFELLCGEIPFRGDTLPEICVRVMTQPVPKLRALRPAVPGALEAVVERCMSKLPSDRYPNVGELALALAPFGSDRGGYAAQRVASVIGARVPSARSDAVALAGTDTAVPVHCGASPTADAGSVGLEGTAPPTGGETAAPWSQTSSRRAPLSRRLLVVVGGAGLAVATAATAAWLRMDPIAAPSAQQLAGASAPRMAVSGSSAASQERVPALSSPAVAPVDAGAGNVSTPPTAANPVPSAQPATEGSPPRAARSAGRRAARRVNGAPVSSAGGGGDPPSSSPVAPRPSAGPFSNLGGRH